MTPAEGTTISLRVVYSPDGNPHDWQPATARAQDAFNTVAAPWRMADNHVNQTASLKHHYTWLQLKADAWLIAHRWSMTTPNEPSSWDNSAAWALWLCIGPLLLMNAAFSRAGPCGHASSIDKNVERIIAQERRLMASPHVDCKRTHLARLIRNPSNPSWGTPKVEPCAQALCWEKRLDRLCLIKLIILSY